MSKVKKHYVNNKEFVELLLEYAKYSDVTDRWFDKIGSRKKEVDIINGTGEEIAERIFLSELKEEQKEEFKQRKVMEYEEKLQKYSIETEEERNERTKKLERIKNRIGKVFISIAEGVLKKPNLINYDYFRKCAMISDACLFMWSYIDRFDTNFDNPFSYFTQAANSAFMQNIKKEKKRTKYFTPLSYIDNINASEEDVEIV